MTGRSPNRKQDIVETKTKLGIQDKRTGEGIVDNRSVDQKNRRLLRQEEGNQEKANVGSVDADAFSESRSGRPLIENSASGMSTAVEQAFWHRWNKIDQGDDGLCHLDLDLIEDLFETGGILLTDADAKDCLDRLPVNQLGKYSGHDVLSYFKSFMTSGAPASMPYWRQVAQRVASMWQATVTSLLDLVETVNKQRIMIDEAKSGKESISSSSTGIIFDGEAPSSVSSTSQFSMSSVMLTGGSSKILGEMRGSVRLAAWQRQQIQNPPSSIYLRATFGQQGMNMDVAKLLSSNANEPTEQNANKAVDKVGAKIGSKGKEKEQEKGKSKTSKDYGEMDEDEFDSSNWRLKFHFDVFCNPLSPDDKREKFFDAETYSIDNSFDDLLPSDLLNRYKFVKQGALGEVEESFGTVIWFGLTVSESATLEQSLLLAEVAINFFKSIPWDSRKDIYTTVEGDLYFLPDTDSDEQTVDSNFDTDKKVANKSNETHEDSTKIGDEDFNIFGRKNRVVIIALLHESDYFREFEESLPRGLLITRFLRSSSIDFQSLFTLAELYKVSLPFEFYNEKLFGPQEEELGEEGMNPLKFAKMNRQRKTAAMEAAEKARSMSLEQLKTHLKTRGLDDTGTREELVGRVQTAFKKQSERIGFGEVSNFGANLAGRIFSIFKGKGSSSDGLNLWEMNSLLDSIGSKTIYDSNAYLDLLQEYSLRRSKEGHLLKSGLVAYYESCGRLAEDIDKVGLGSLDTFLKGEATVNIDFDTEGISTLFDLLENHTFLNTYLKKLLSVFSSLEKFNIEGYFPKFSDVLKLGDDASTMQKFKKFLSTPGVVATTIHAFMDALADGDEGFIRSFRLFTFQEFGQYDSWESIYMEKFPSSSADRKGDRETTNPESMEFQDMDPTSFKKGDTPLKRKLRRIREDIHSILPVVVNGSDISEEKLKVLKDKYDRFDRILVDKDVRLTAGEVEKVKTLRNEAGREASSLSKKLEEVVRLSAAHTCAFYDAVRLFSKGICTIGTGTREFCVRGTVEGADFVDFLPRANGERSVAKEMREGKLRRANQRKKAALAALEKERLKRATDPEERERLNAANKNAMKEKREAEENKLFSEAFQALYKGREARMSTDDLASMITLFERISLLKSNRYPNTLQASVSENNLACVLFEFCGIDHPRNNDTMQIFEKLGKEIPIFLAQYQPQSQEQITHKNDNETINSEGASNPSRSSKGESYSRNGSNGSKVHYGSNVSVTQVELPPIPDNEISPNIVMLQNIVSYFRIIGHTKKLTKYEGLLHVIFDLYHKLSQKEQDMVANGVSRTVNTIPVFPLGNFKDQFQLTLMNVASQRGIVDDKSIDNETVSLETTSNLHGNSISEGDAEGQNPMDHLSILSPGGMDDESHFEDGGMILTPRRLKKIKYEKQREADKILRAQTVMQRRRLYQMIQTNEITAVFKKKSNSKNYGADTQWGSDTDSVSQFDPFGFSMSIDTNTVGHDSLDLETLGQNSQIGSINTMKSKKIGPKEEPKKESTPDVALPPQTISETNSTKQLDKPETKTARSFLSWMRERSTTK